MRTEVEKTDAELRQIQEKLDMLLKAGANDQIISMTVKSMDIQQMRGGTEKQCWLLMDIESDAIRVVKLPDNPPPVWYAVRIKVYRQTLIKEYRWQTDAQATLYASEVEFGFSIIDLSAVPRVVGQFIRDHLRADEFMVANGYIAVEYPIEGETIQVMSPVYHDYPVQVHKKT